MEVANGGARNNDIRENYYLCSL